MLQSHLLRKFIPCCTSLYLLIIMCMSCSGLSPREQQQRRLLAKLDSSIKRELVFIDQQTQLLLSALEGKTLEVHTSERAKVWQAVAKKVQASAETANDQITTMIDVLNAKNAYTLFIKGPWCDSLYQILDQFQQNSLGADKQLAIQFKQSPLPHEVFSQSLPKDDIKKLLQQDFAHLGNKEAKALLCYWQKEIAMSANELITYCFYQVPNNNFCGIKTELLVPLVSQNQQKLTPGETLAITAGIGSYTVKVKPRILINGQIAPLTDDAVAFYKLKVGNIKGKYSIPVVINYLDQNGIEMASRTNVEYTVE